MLKPVLIAVLLAILVAIVFSAVDPLDSYAAVAGIVTFIVVLLASLTNGRRDIL